MLAAGRIQTLFRQTQALDRPSAYDVRLNDLFDVRFGNAAVPDGIGIDHHIRAVLALVEASGLIRADASVQAMGRQLLLEEFLQASFRQRIAATPRMTWRSLVSANEDMFFEFRHPYSQSLSEILPETNAFPPETLRSGNPVCDFELERLTKGDHHKKTIFSVSPAPAWWMDSHFVAMGCHRAIR
jgi:hypothetical protein